MKLEIEKCSLNTNEVKLVCKFAATIDEIMGMCEKDDSYTIGSLRERILTRMAIEVSGEYLKKNKSEIIKSLNKDEIVNGIGIKIIEGFSLQRRR